HCGDLCLRNDDAIYLGLSTIAADIAAALDLGDVIFEGIARARRAAEARLVDAKQHDDALLVVARIMADRDGAANLRHALDDEDAREDWRARKVTLESRLVDGDVLDADRRVVAVDLDNPVNHEHRITVRQRAEDI